MAIATNVYADLITEDADGNALEQPRLFGKMGFQTVGPKTDKNIVANMASLEAALDAGELQDALGNSVTTGAVIWLPVLVTKITPADERVQVSRFRNSAGGYATVPAMEAVADEPKF